MPTALSSALLGLLELRARALAAVAATVVVLVRTLGVAAGAGLVLGGGDLDEAHACPFRG